MKWARKNYDSGLAEGELLRLRKSIEIYTSTVTRLSYTLRAITEVHRQLIDEEKELRSEYIRVYGYNPTFQDEHE